MSNDKITSYEIKDGISMNWGMKLRQETRKLIMDEKLFLVRLLYKSKATVVENITSGNRSRNITCVEHHLCNILCFFVTGIRLNAAQQLLYEWVTRVDLKRLLLAQVVAGGANITG